MAQGVGRGIALLFHDRGTRSGFVVSSTPRPHFTPGKTRYPFHRRLVGPQGRSGRAEKLVPTGIRSQTVQPIISRYTNRATLPTIVFSYSSKLERRNWRDISLAARRHTYPLTITLFVAYDYLQLSDKIMLSPYFVFVVPCGPRSC